MKLDMITDKLKQCGNRIESTIERLKNEHKSVVLYDAGYCGHETYKLMKGRGVRVSAVCDDAHSGERMYDIRISRINDFVPDANTIIFVTSGFNATMKDKLKALNLWSYCEDVDFGRYDSERENYEYFVDHQAELNSVYDLLSDSKSKRLFINLINYRISRDQIYLEGMTETTPQYFPSEQTLNIKANAERIFLDCGAFDGDTVRAFLNHVGRDYERIIAVEPNKKNYELMRKNLATVPNVEYHNVGIFDRRTRLHFIDDGITDYSFVDECGETVIDTDSIDNLLNGRAVTFIKMDIEGAEYEALVGAKHTLKKYTPTLAVCVYHKVEDLFRLQLLIEDTCPNKYDYYLRHYSPTVIETVLFALPKNRQEEWFSLLSK